MVLISTTCTHACQLFFQYLRWQFLFQSQSSALPIITVTLSSGFPAMVFTMHVIKSFLRIRFYINFNFLLKETSVTPASYVQNISCLSIRMILLVNVACSLIFFPLPTGHLFLSLFLSLKLFLELFKAMTTALCHEPPF